jgi:hypothetical protein
VGRRQKTAAQGVRFCRPSHSYSDKTGYFRLILRLSLPRPPAKPSNPIANQHVHRNATYKAAWPGTIAPSARLARAATARPPHLFPALPYSRLPIPLPNLEFLPKQAEYCTCRKTPVGNNTSVSVQALSLVTSVYNSTTSSQTSDIFPICQYTACTFAPAPLTRNSNPRPSSAPT